MAIVLAFLASMLPSVLFFVWFKRLDKDKAEYSSSCNKALLYGMLSSIPIVIVALILHSTFYALGLGESNVLIQEAFNDFILYALLEEAFKFLFFIRLLHKTAYDYSWLDVISFMTLIGIGFEILEAFVYAFSTGIAQVLARGITLMHGGYGFIMGYFFGKALYTGKKRYFAAAFLIPFLLHGVYDYSLSPKVLAISEAIVLIPASLAAFALVLLIVMIVFFIRARKKEKYNSALKKI